MGVDVGLMVQDIVGVEVTEGLGVGVWVEVELKVILLVRVNVFEGVKE